MSTTVVSGRVAPAQESAAPRRSRPRPARILLHTFLIIMAVGWLFPVAWAVANSFRDYQYTSEHGYVSFGGWTIQNYIHAWERADFTKHFLNSVYVTVPAVLATLFLSSCVAFVLARFTFKFNLAMLG